jgi:hypothetical protein
MFSDLIGLLDADRPRAGLLVAPVHVCHAERHTVDRSEI